MPGEGYVQVLTGLVTFPSSHLIVQGLVEVIVPFVPSCLMTLTPLFAQSGGASIMPGAL